MNEKRLPEPEEGVDYYIAEWSRCTISIEVSVNAFKERNSDSEISSEAVRLFREGTIDGDATLVYSEKIKDVALEYKTDLPFNHEAWQISKCAKLELHPDGTPLRPNEKEQPKNQTKIGSFLEVVLECEK